MAYCKNKDRDSDNTLDFSFEEVLASLNDRDPDGFTMQEMSKKVGRSVGWCRQRMAGLIERKLFECSGKRMIVRIDGSVGYSPIYRKIA